MPYLKPPTAVPLSNKSLDYQFEQNLCVRFEGLRGRFSLTPVKPVHSPVCGWLDCGNPIVLVGENADRWGSCDHLRHSLRSVTRVSSSCQVG
jgi:hypothetical protein